MEREEKQVDGNKNGSQLSNEIAQDLLEGLARCFVNIHSCQIYLKDFGALSFLPKDFVHRGTKNTLACVTW